MSNRAPRATDGWGSGQAAVDAAAFFGVRMFRNLDFWIGGTKQRINQLITKTSPCTPAKSKDSIILQNDRDQDLTGRDAFVQGITEDSTFATGSNNWRLDELLNLKTFVNANYSGSSGRKYIYKKGKMDLFLNGTKPFIAFPVLCITPSGSSFSDQETSEYDPMVALAAALGDDQKIIPFPEVVARPFYPGSTTPHYRAEIGLNMVPVLNMISKLCDESEFNLDSVPEFRLIAMCLINDTTNGKTVNWDGLMWTSVITQAR